MEQILYLLSQAVRSAIIGTEVQRKCVPHVLHDLIGLGTRPACLTEIAFNWCFVIYENRESLGNWKRLLLASLEIGFRHLDPQDQPTQFWFTSTETRPEMTDVVFGSQKSEAIADFLHARIVCRPLCSPSDVLAERLVCLHNLVPFSPRLRLLVIRSIELIDYGQFKGVGVERFVGLLNHLHVKVEDMDIRPNWLELLLETLQTLERAQHLSYRYWELAVELAVSQSLWHVITYNPQTATFLTEAQEWSKLECWMGTVWIVWPPEADGITEEDLGRLVPLLFRKRPGAFGKIEQWMEQWSKKFNKNIPGSFQRICEQAQEIAQRDTP